MYYSSVLLDSSWKHNKCSVYKTLNRSSGIAFFHDQNWSFSFREVDDTWAKAAAIEAIEKLTETEKPKSPINDVPVRVFEEEDEEEENQVKYASDSSQDNNVVASPSKDWTVDRVATDVTETVTSDTGLRISEGFVDLVEVEVGAGFSAARSDMIAEESTGKSEDIECGKAGEW